MTQVKALCVWSTYFLDVSVNENKLSNNAKSILIPLPSCFNLESQMYLYPDGVSRHTSVVK